MKDPYYFADEKELFAKIFEMSDELTRTINTARPKAEVPSKKRKPRGEAIVRNSEAGEGQVLPISL